MAGKAGWLAEGRPGEGLVEDSRRAAAASRRDVPRVEAGATLADVAAVVGDWELAVVTTGDGTVVGVVRAEAAAGPGEQRVERVMQTAPATVRPSISQRELAQSMDGDGQAHVLVTTLDGRLVGLVRREDLQ